jgi:uncharacterized protein YeaO (DUF488 family)
LERGPINLKFRTVQIGTPREPGEGLRIGTVRFPPRGVPKDEYQERNLFDVWLPVIAPSRELLRAFHDSGMTFPRFAERYRREMSKTAPRQVIKLLAEMAKATPISVGCHCADESRCHRSILGELIREAAGLSPLAPLANDSVYTIAHGAELQRIAEGKTRSAELFEQKHWTTAAQLLVEARQRGESVPIIFADATDCSRLVFWARLDSVDFVDDRTRYRFSKLTKIRGRHTPQELVLASTGKTIAPGFIRPYALVRTPNFID